ncbi:FSIP1 protein, partial [Polypterus senegalus]
MDICKGSLDEISRPASGSRSRTDAVDAAKGNASDWTEDPELFKAIEKMKRLDKILASAVLKEKEVKQQGNELRVKLWDELQSSKSEDNPETHEESENTRKFLALTPASSKSYFTLFIPKHPLDPLLTDFSIEDSTIVHVFETQLADEEFDQYFSKPMQQVHGDWTESIAKLEASPDTDTSDRPESRCSRVKQKKKKKRDFVKKNIELAKDAGNQVLMTDNEKKRLAELLRDIDNDRSDTLPRDELYRTARSEMHLFTYPLRSVAPLEQLKVKGLAQGPSRVAFLLAVMGIRTGNLRDASADP